jgi:hypothetical protein
MRRTGRAGRVGPEGRGWQGAVGGTRPGAPAWELRRRRPAEALLHNGPRRLIAKFSSGTDIRGGQGGLVSALTILGLDELSARYASYADLADLIRARFTEPTATLRELFSRITFNVLTGNSDDHARNHAAFWDGAELTLTPAYDICPQSRGGGETSQATRSR